MQDIKAKRRLINVFTLQKHEREIYVLKDTKFKKRNTEELCANDRPWIETYNFDFIAQVMCGKRRPKCGPRPVTTARVPQGQDRDATAPITG